MSSILITPKGLKGVPFKSHLTAQVLGHPLANQQRQSLTNSSVCIVNLCEDAGQGETSTSKQFAWRLDFEYILSIYHLLRSIQFAFWRKPSSDFFKCNIHALGSRKRGFRAQYLAAGWSASWISIKAVSNKIICEYCMCIYIYLEQYDRTNYRN